MAPEAHKYKLYKESLYTNRSEFFSECIIAVWNGLSPQILAQLILRKIVKIVATRCHILTLKCTNIGLRSPRAQAKFKGPTFKERGEKGRGGTERGGESTCLPPRFDNPDYGSASEASRFEQLTTAIFNTQRS